MYKAVIGIEAAVTLVKLRIFSHFCVCTMFTFVSVHVIIEWIFFFFFVLIHHGHRVALCDVNVL